MINSERILDHFLRLVGIDSLSRKEREIALVLRSELAALGAEIFFDDAGEQVAGDIGNLIARFPGTRKSASPFLLSAHMDTVGPGEGIRARVDGRIIRTDGTTILGGDDKSGIACILEAIRTLQEKSLPYGEIEVVLTICEEVGLLGAKHLDTARLHSRQGLVLDCTGSGYLFTRAPASDRMEFTIHGQEAHAGVCPEEGISAIQVAAEGIAAMRLGRIDPETTANLGTIAGGLATNIVPNKVIIKGEARSHSDEKLQAQTAHMHRCLKEAASQHRIRAGGRTIEARVEERIWRDYDRMALPEEAPIVRLVKEAARRISLAMETRSTGGGCDANVLNQRGILIANLSTGMHDIHTVKEWVDVGEMTSTAEILVQALILNAEGS